MHYLLGLGEFTATFICRIPILMIGFEYVGILRRDLLFRLSLVHSPTLCLSPSSSSAQDLYLEGI